MVDYPQHLAMAAIVRWLHDPARGFAHTYPLALTRPNTLFALLVAALCTLIPPNLAGKLVIALALAAVGPAAVALARRAGRPDWYALLAIAATYNFVFYWGLVGNLLAYPQVIAAIAWADLLLDRPPSVRTWLILALLALSFYFTHLQFQFIFMGALGWLTLVRRPRLRDGLLQLSSALPALAVTLVCSLSLPEKFGYYQQARYGLEANFMALGRRLNLLPMCMFGTHEDGPEYQLLALALLVLVAALAFREPAQPRRPLHELLYTTRFATLALWILLLYCLLPMNVLGGGFLFQRLAPLLLMLCPAAFPSPPPKRAPLLKVLIGGLMAAQILVTTTESLRYQEEAAGVQELIEHTEPGKNLAGLMLQRSSRVVRTAPVFLHYPALYQVFRGGRISLSFAEHYVSIAQYRDGQAWDDLVRDFNEYTPRGFSYEKHGARFDYFFVHGPPEALKALFGPHLSELDVESRENWHLLRRRPIRIQSMTDP